MSCRRRGKSGRSRYAQGKRPWLKLPCRNSLQAVAVIDLAGLKRDNSPATGAPDSSSAWSRRLRHHEATESGYPDPRSTVRILELDRGTAQFEDAFRDERPLSGDAIRLNQGSNVPTAVPMRQTCPGCGLFPCRDRKCTVASSFAALVEIDVIQPIQTEIG